MRAMPWQHEVPWQPDAGAALRALQVEEFRRKYDFCLELEKQRVDAEQALKAEQQSGDRFRLAAIWSAQLKTIAEVASKPRQTTEEQIKSLRRVLPDGYGNILDVTGIDQAGGVQLIRPLTPQEVEQSVGTQLPTLARVRKSLYAVMRMLGRGESVAFAAYSETGTPENWVFVGLTVD